MFIFSSTFNLLHHFKMRQAFVFTLVIVLISQFNRDQATELLIESAESRLLDLRVAGSTDVHNSSDGPHEICKQLHQDGFQLSMNANGPSIKSLCDGFKNKQEGKCIVGRCECPEERQFCTNNADSKKKFQKPIIYNDPTEQFGKTMKVPTKKSSAYESNSEREKSDWVKDEYKRWARETFWCILLLLYIITTAIGVFVYYPHDWTSQILFFIANLIPLISCETEYYEYAAFRIVLKANILFCMLQLLFILYSFLCLHREKIAQKLHHYHEVLLILEQLEHEAPQPDNRTLVPRTPHTGRKLFHYGIDQ
ncbi:uncharacterized protein LOC109532875 isoform X1 [Dendroctonus ponderosae]|uniref:Uncharacterized protein n=1 Tax=Dendroctonus ponderosae TaxID=77166 RepID=A0AAR5NZ59_DENPD|nr:uncharacterized protein LOC109532875 isoform X1 [Dendroctonus ponderosae]